MAPQALGFVVAWWTIWEHATPALSQDGAGIDLRASTNIGEPPQYSLFLPVRQKADLRIFALYATWNDTCAPHAAHG